MVRTPIRAADDLIVPDGRSRSVTCYTKVRELDASILVRQDIGTLDVAMYDTLVVQIYQTFKDLRNVHADQLLREFSKALADVMERSILAESVVFKSTT